MDKEALVRAFDAMQSKDGTRRDVSSALTITSQERLYVIQVRSHSDGLAGSSLVLPWRMLAGTVRQPCHTHDE